MIASIGIGLVLGAAWVIVETLLAARRRRMQDTDGDK